ncbi:MAG: RNA polymerase sporulation sigma factor SigK [Bacillales bacterium]|nr:RNA polymerase sporulation sigma factor SigK [Bacillales bacterium]
MFLNLILSLLNCSFLLGFIQNSVLPPSLSPQEEEKCMKEFFNQETHDEARNKLITHNLRLVAHIASKYESKDENIDDLISIGTIGLVKAVDTFSYEKNVKLATYAARCIENEILMVLRSNKKHSKNVSLNEPLGVDKDGQEIHLIDIYPSIDDSLEEQLETKQKIKALNRYLEILDERELKIISLRYGLNNEVEHTQKEISKMYHISRSYVSRIEKRALIKLLSEFKKYNY